SSEILNILSSCGLLLEDSDPNDKRKKRYYLPENVLPHTEGENISITDVYKTLREKLTKPFYTHEAVELIREIRQCNPEEAEKLFTTFQNEGKVFLNPYGLWEWTR
ncbi:MAG: hypothetical protein RMK50_07190, partial [Nitrososphaerota archaeon]|nr:hypothetical protein [Candidatus Bathyarchaeota archaeon]MDW8194583.1 hypothetical protein [Nitrososphaerota archaeon]